MNNRQPVSLKELAVTLADYDMFLVYIIRFLTDISYFPASAYLTLTVLC